MFGQVVNMLTEVLSNIIAWFTMVFEGSGMTGYYLVAIFLLLLGRYILRPLLGFSSRAGASDTVSRNGGKKNV